VRLLLAQVAVPVGPSPAETAEGISKLGLYYVIGVLCAVVVALFGYVVLSHHNRMSDRDARDKRLDALQERHGGELKTLLRESSAFVQETGKALYVLQQAVQELRAEVKALRPRGRGAPALGPEPTSQAGRPPGAPP
jgi:hypothetical protein